VKVARVNRQPNSKTITYSYDPNGNRATLRDPDGGRFTYSHDAADRIASASSPSTRGRWAASTFTNTTATDCSPR
jgi:YD repeat-containing protein